MRNEQKSEYFFLFIHGLGATSQDLILLKDEFTNSGFHCESIDLKGHNSRWENLEKFEYKEWFNQINEAIKLHSTKKIFLIGFSIGATLALDIARQKNIAGVIAISAFLEPTYKKSVNFLLLFFNYFRIQKIKRFVQTTIRRTQKHINSYNYLPLSTLEMAVNEGKRVKESTKINCPTLFLHSRGDKVANFWSVTHCCLTV